jgi:hypothetical protein
MKLSFNNTIYNKILFVVLSLVIVVCFFIVLNSIINPTTCDGEKDLKTEQSSLKAGKNYTNPDIIIFCCKDVFLNEKNLVMEDIDALAIAVGLVCKCEKTEME